MTRLIVSFFALCFLFATLHASFSEDFAITVCHPYIVKIEGSLKQKLPNGPDAYKLIRVFKGFGSSLRKKFLETGPFSFAELDFDDLVKNIFHTKLEEFKSQNKNFAKTFTKWDVLLEEVRLLLEQGFDQYETAQNSKANLSPLPEINSPSEQSQSKASFDVSVMNPFASGFDGFDPLNASRIFGLNLQQMTPDSSAPMETFNSISDFHKNMSSLFPDFHRNNDDMLASMMPFVSSPTQGPQVFDFDFSDEALPLDPLHLIPDWPVSSFLLELTKRLSQDLLPNDDIIFGHDSFEPIIALLRSLSQEILDAANTGRLRFAGSFSEVLQELVDFFYNQVYLPLRQSGDLEGSDFELLNDVAIHKGSLFSAICESVLKQFYDRAPEQIETEDFTQLREENDYIRLAIRLGIDINTPEELLMARNSEKLANLGINMSDPGFKSFVNEIIMIYDLRRCVLDDGEEENDENRSPVTPVKLSSLPKRASPLRSSPSRKPSTPDHHILRLDSDSRRAKNNSKVVSRLGRILKYEDLVKKGLKRAVSKVVRDPAIQQSYVIVIFSSLEDFVNDSVKFNLIPLGATMPLPAQISMITRITEACQEFDQMTLGCPSLGLEVAKEASEWISTKMFVAYSKSRAVENWNLSHSADLETPSLGNTPQFSPLQLSPESQASPSPQKGQSPVKKASFGPDQICEFCWKSSPNSIGESWVGNVPSDDDYDPSSLVHPFPFNGTDRLALLANPVHLRDTAEHFHKYGNTDELKLNRRKIILVKAINSLKDDFADTDSTIRAQISKISQQALDKALPSYTIKK